jgi:hypothetical protein
MTQTIGPRAGSYSDASELSLFRTLLGSEEFSIPLGSNFFIQIASIPTAVASTDNLQYFEPGRSAGWNIADGTNSLINFHNDGRNANGACLFANGITPPVEAINVARVGMHAAFDEHSGGLLDGVVTRSRKQQDSVAISFLETNQSFIDFVIRPWVILTGHVGLIARARGSVDDVKTTITATFFSRYNGQVSPRKIFTFFGCAPVSIDTATAYDYGTNAVNTIKTTWAYNYYTLSFTDVNIPVNTEEEYYDIPAPGTTYGKNPFAAPAPTTQKFGTNPFAAPVPPTQRFGTNLFNFEIPKLPAATKVTNAVINNTRPLSDGDNTENRDEFAFFPAPATDIIAKVTATPPAAPAQPQPRPLPREAQRLYD